MHCLLHIDTSTDTCIVAVNIDGQLAAHRIFAASRDHARSLNLLISEVLGEQHISFHDLSGIVVCAGPGSYTGLRIGTATAKGLCYVLDIPLILDNKLTLLADQNMKGIGGRSNICSLLYAREKEYFIAVYDKEFNCLTEPRHIMENQLQELVKLDVATLFITDIFSHKINEVMFNDLQIVTDTQIDLRNWCKWAYDEYKCNRIVNLANAEPFYLKQAFTHN